MKLLAFVLSACFVGLGCNGSGSSGGDGGADQADPLAGDKAVLIGDWSGAGAELHIGADRAISWVQRNGATSKSYTGKVKRIEANQIVINALVNIDLKVQKWPAEVDGSTVMTVEGIDVYKGGLVGNLNAIITQKFKADGFTKTECPATVTADTKTFQCMSTVAAANGAKQVKVTVTEKTKGDYDFHVETTGLVANKVVDLMPKTMGNMKLDHVDCGTGVIYVDNGGTFDCKGVDTVTKKNVKITTTMSDGGDLHFHAVYL